MKVEYNWKEEIEAYRNSGLTIKEWCESRDYTMSKFKSHMYGKYERNKKQTAAPVFVEVAAKVSDSITIQMGGASIVVNESTNIDLLKKIMVVMNHD